MQRNAKQENEERKHDTDENADDNGLALPEGGGTRGYPPFESVARKSSLFHPRTIVSHRMVADCACGTLA